MLRDEKEPKYGSLWCFRSRNFFYRADFYPWVNKVRRSIIAALAREIYDAITSE